VVCEQASCGAMRNKAVRRCGRCRSGGRHPCCVPLASGVRKSEPPRCFDALGLFLHNCGPADESEVVMPTNRGSPLAPPILDAIAETRMSVVCGCGWGKGLERWAASPVCLSVPCDCVGSSQSHICMRPGRSQIRCRGGQPLELRRNWARQMTGHGAARLAGAVGPGRPRSNYLQTANCKLRTCQRGAVGPHNGAVKHCSFPPQGTVCQQGWLGFCSGRSE
jgi:hypothetical protein